tara:strand:+ start:3198 stop:3473 length:276 start_codon:yes stop_codon:yes gene_type:complete
MRDNFRPNLRLKTNILLVIGTFLIAFNLSQLNNKQDKSIKQRKIDCANASAGAISYNDFIKTYKIGIFDNKRKEYTDYELLAEFCQFYMFK